MTTSAIDQPHFQDADEARKYLEEQVWPDGPVCPHCGSVKAPYVLKNKSARPGLYKCADCRESFTVTVGTIFERSKIPLNKWLLASYLLCSSKKGISSHQIHRMLGVTYKTAWFMTHRIREAMGASGGLLGSDGGPVEVDETYWGNIGQNKGKPGWNHKMKVVSLVEQDGEKRSFHVQHVSGAALRPILLAQISQKAHLMTDEAGQYLHVGKEFSAHGVVNHRAGEFARGEVTTNTVESSFALLKRGLIGTFHHVSEQHLQRYATEFDFRWNYRTKLGYTDTMRANVLLGRIVGKRLMYREATKGQK